MSINRWMDKEAEVHLYNGISFSHKKNTFELVLMRWVNPKPDFFFKDVRMLVHWRRILGSLDRQKREEAKILVEAKDETGVGNLNME